MLILFSEHIRDIENRLLSFPVFYHSILQVTSINVQEYIFVLAYLHLQIAAFHEISSISSKNRVHACLRD